MSLWLPNSAFTSCFNVRVDAFCTSYLFFYYPPPPSPPVCDRNFLNCNSIRVMIYLYKTGGCVPDCIPIIIYIFVLISDTRKWLRILFLLKKDHLCSCYWNEQNWYAYKKNHNLMNIYMYMWYQVNMDPLKVI